MAHHGGAVVQAVILLLLLYPWSNGSAEAQTMIPFHVGVLLDVRSPVGATARVGISLALEDFYSQHGFYSTRLVLHYADTGNSTIGTVSAALSLLQKDRVRAILGPQRSAQAVFISDLGNTTQVPVISASATSPTLTSSHSPYFIRAASNDSSQVDAISAIVKAFRWRQVVPIYEDSSFGTGVMPYLIDALQSVSARVPYRSVLPVSATDDQILEELYKLMTMQTRIFIVHMSPVIGSRLFQKAKEIGMMSKGYTWIMTDGLTSVLDLLDPLTINSMQGMIGVKHYIPETREYEDFKFRWERRFRQENPGIRRVDLSIYGIWAYDSAWALALAVESIRDDIELLLQDPDDFGRSPMNLENLDASRIGPKLRDAILKTRFNGFAGEFWLIDNQLQSSTFQIVNVNGRGGREIGFWTPAHGLSRTLAPSKETTYSASATDLGVVIWPGESTSIPKGWQTPTNDRILRIGVPVKDGFEVFVNVVYDSVTNASMVTGYCIDVFEAVLQKLPYALSYEYVPFRNNEGEMAGSYNDLVQGVFDQRFDAVVGDVTITANRSEYVDFTLPYTESGVAMIVPVRKRPNNTWIFLRPMTWDLWLSTLAFILFTGFIIWVMENGEHGAFQGEWREQLGRTLYFMFSTLVFFHKEDITRNLTRIVVITWVFVVLILTTSYTASLTSILTVVKLEPTIKDMQQLIENGDSVGYHKGSFTETLLKKNFDAKKMKALTSPESYLDAFQNGSVSVIFHEIPYIKLFLSRYCSGYTMSEPTHKTAGFGFVFPKGSPIVPDISRAILNVTEGDQFAKLEKKWFGDSCVNQDNSIDPHSLTFRGFWGLFLITGLTSLIAMLIFCSCWMSGMLLDIDGRCGNGAEISGSIEFWLSSVKASVAEVWEALFGVIDGELVKVIVLTTS